MYTITNDELRALSSKDISSLKERAKSGDGAAICKMAMCILYAQAEDSEDDMQKYLSLEEVAKDEMALLLRGFSYEHAIGTTKNYAKAVECYSKAYDLLNNIHSSGKEVKDGAKAFQEIEKRYDKLTKNVGQVIAVKKFCQFKDGQFFFPWTDETRSSIGKLLPQLSNDVAEFGELFAKAITNLKDEVQGEWEFRYQDTLLMPVEVMKTLAARDFFEHFLKDNGFQIFPTDPYLKNALGRCLIDDDDAFDNDYIIGGLLNMAGHEGDPLWQYRAGLWYEYCDNNLEPKTAAYWYEQAKNGMPAAKIAIERVKGSLQYRILENSKEGTAKECQSLMNRSSKNPQNSVSWLIEKALRGDESAMQRIEHNQFAPKGNTSVFSQQFTPESIQPYYTLLKEETSADKKVKKGWADLMQKEKDEYRKRVEEEERRRKEEERKRLEAERKAEEERIRKIKEAEEAKRRAEEEAIRKAKKAEEDRIRKAKEAEESKRRAEEEAKRKAEEEARRKAEAIKANEERLKQLMAEIKKTEENYQNLADKWEKEGLSEYEFLRKKLKDAEEKFEPLLKAAARKWWQIPFYEAGTWTVQKCLSHERNNGKEKLGSFEEKKKKIESIADKLEQLLNTRGIERNKDLLETRSSELKQTLKKYEKEVDEAISIFDNINLQINRLKDGRALQMVEPEFNGKRIAIFACVFLGICLFAWLFKQCLGPSEEALMAKYDSISAPSTDGSRVVVLNGKKGIIYKSGHEMVEPKYDDISELFEDEVRIVKLNGKTGVLKKNGEELVPPECDEIRNLVATDERVELDADTLVISEITRLFVVNGKMGLIRTKSGEASGEIHHNASLSLGIIFPPEYDTIYYSNEYKTWLGRQ